MNVDLLQVEFNLRAQVPDLRGRGITGCVKDENIREVWSTSKKMEGEL